MNQTLLDDYRAVSVTNREYMRNRDRWEFLLYSYVGGEEYRRQGYLTKYQLETEGEYNQRLKTTPLDNHAQSVISVYSSFLFKDCPEREFMDWEGRVDLESFLNDADLEGRDLDSFMKDIAVWNSVFGHTWIIMTKPNIGAESLGAELDMGIRPYINMLTPLAVMDWTWTRGPTGRYELTYFKYIEEIVGKVTVVREWTNDLINTWVMDDDKKEAYLKSTEVNGLGCIPAILSYNKRSIVKGIGVSDISDIADMQRLIYNYNSEIEQSHRLDGHPSLVVTPDTQYGSGAGAVIQIPNDLEPGLKPYVLEHGGGNIGALHESINQLVDSIDNMSNTGAVRGQRTASVSGVALEVEFALLNARLSEKADSLELTEEQMWELFGLYQGLHWNGEVKYPDSFNIRDVDREFAHLVSAKSAATDPRVLAVIDHEVIELLGEDADIIMPELVNGQQLDAMEPFEPRLLFNPQTGDELMPTSFEQKKTLLNQGWVEKE